MKHKTETYAEMWLDTSTLLERAKTKKNKMQKVWSVHLSVIQEAQFPGPKRAMKKSWWIISIQDWLDQVTMSRPVWDIRLDWVSEEFERLNKSLNNGCWNDEFYSLWMTQSGLWSRELEIQMWNKVTAYE